MTQVVKRIVKECDPKFVHENKGKVKNVNFEFTLNMKVRKRVDGCQKPKRL